MNTIHKKRIDLNHWEIIGIENYLKETFNVVDDFSYSDGTIYLDVEEKRFAVYKISHGEDLYLTMFNDDSENITYHLNLSNDTFTEIAEDFDYIAEHENIFE